MIFFKQKLAVKQWKKPLKIREMKIIQLDEFYEKKTKIRESFLTNFWYFFFPFQTRKTERLFSEDTKKHKKDEATRRELQTLRNRLNCGGTSNRMDDFDDLLNASSHKVQKTKVDVRSENAKKFREMFDKGEVPEGKEAGATVIPATAEKDAELELMRKSKREQREYFQMMEAGKLENIEKKRKEPKLLVGKLKDVSFRSDNKIREHLFTI